MRTEKTRLAQKYSEATSDRQRRKRAKELLQRLQHEGHGSLDEIQRDAEEMKDLPETWQGRLRNPPLGQENVTADDLPPSRRVIETLVKDLKKKPRIAAAKKKLR